MAHRLAEIAGWVGGRLLGDGEAGIEGLRPLGEAGPGDLAFAAGAGAEGAARASRAGALLVAAPVEGFAGAQIVVADPRAAYGEVLERMHPPRRAVPGVHATAVVDAAASVDPGAEVGPFAVVGAGSRIAAGAILDAHVVVGRACEVGEDCLLHAHAVLYDGTRIGAGCIVHAGAVLGSDGFGYRPVGGVPRKIPQVGHVEIGEQVEIGANTTVDRATLGVTAIGAHAKIDNLVQVAHNVTVGRGAILCAQAGVAGSTRLGDGVVLAGQAGVTDHRVVGAGARVSAKSAVMKDVEPGQDVAGIPAVPAPLWRRQQALLRRLADWAARLRRLERQLGREREEGPSD
ncbi:MAG: UDP-3-O-(3-hydroxymyristoyl)glucosamine N-acyltransferase [Thermoanaerobaculia bacterium]|nr:UDP-3-O-(3-hydroxymyristoyl)glucosamine N-acyltransferase [Thermoanaerobaculia bacterium]MCZ7650965.1 UDP-3-O-(3-hydroxymyristoyl)glucosamine N-acyltransferase [Thermoanaerobaculia bacterium]